MYRKRTPVLMDRRQFLSTAALTAACFSLQSPVLSWAATRPRSLSFYHTHTREKLDITYGYAKHYIPEALLKINHFLKDFRTGEIHPIDPRLLDLLYSVGREFSNQGTFEVISAYRSPQTNRQLRKSSSKVAKHSLHMEGKAIDIRLTGVRTRKLQKCALQMQCGGVGYYQKSDFIHLDTGRVRSW